MSSTSNVCRSILDTQTVVKERVLELLAEKLVPLGVNKDVCQELGLHVSSCIDTQTDSLLDRVSNELSK